MINSVLGKLIIMGNLWRWQIKGGYLDFSNLTELKNIYINEITIEKPIRIINN